MHSIPYAQFIRLRCNCTHKADFRLLANELRLRLRQRGYSKCLLRQAFNKTLNRERTSLIHPRPKGNDDQRTMRFITKYSVQHQQLRNCLHKNWYLLSEDPTMGKYVKNTPEIVFRRSSSIENKLTSHRPEVNTNIPNYGISTCCQCTYCIALGCRQAIHFGWRISIPAFKQHVIRRV